MCVCAPPLVCVCISGARRVKSSLVQLPPGTGHHTVERLPLTEEVKIKPPKEAAQETGSMKEGRMCRYESAISRAAFQMSIVGVLFWIQVVCGFYTPPLFLGHLFTSLPIDSSNPPVEGRPCVIRCVL